MAGAETPLSAGGVPKGEKILDPSELTTFDLRRDRRFVTRQVQSLPTRVLRRPTASGRRACAGIYHDLQSDTISRVRE